MAIISNVGTAHLENLKTMENIAKAKLEIVEGLKEHGLFIYNGDQEILQNAVTQAQIPGHIRIRTFGVKPQNRRHHAISHITQKREGVSFCLNDDVCPYHVDADREASSDECNSCLDCSESVRFKCRRNPRRLSKY